jgi:hypothetical protein
MENEFELNPAFLFFDEEFYGSATVDSEHSFPSVYYAPKKFKLLDSHLKFTFARQSSFGVFSKEASLLKSAENSHFGKWISSRCASIDHQADYRQAQLIIDLHSTLFNTPGSFDLQIRSSQIILFASDFNGANNGLRALFSLFTSLGAVEEENLTIPSLLVSDSPKLAQRAVIWSFQNHLMVSKNRLQQQLSILTTLQYNLLILNLDKLFDSPDIGLDISELTTLYNNFRSECANASIDLIPAIFLSQNQPITSSITNNNNNNNNNSNNTSISNNSAQQIQFLKGLNIEKLMIFCNFEYSQEKNSENHSAQKAIFTHTLTSLKEFSNLQCLSFAFNENAQELFAEELVKINSIVCFDDRFLINLFSIL